MNSYFSTLDNLPEADALTSILTRYSDIIFDNVTDGENPGTQSSAAGDDSQGTDQYLGRPCDTGRGSANVPADSGHSQDG